MNSVIANRRSEQGFTLVELAIVMIIIGLLIGGILKGQELIANARVAATVAQVKGIDAATTTFRDKYDSLPGDMAAPATRLPAGACGGANCGGTGNGNNQLDVGPLVAPSAAETTFFFQHLAAADLMSGIDFGGGCAAWGDCYPAAEVAGGFHAGFYNGTGGLGASTTAPAGHYLGLVLTSGAVSAANTLTPNQGQRIDTKLDDGAATTGSVVSTAGGCVNGNIYDETNQGQVCDLALRFQN